ncbi:2-amino-4-hydroxy-6-hydroxymethyldihydropteridine diphosphokinase [Neolewinella agarilytica]|uniref:2-amino-4-hydroxy-6- hydroxymethyldihydropteridine diphosphokinase n=1 Tax=Neolewinella agarilytica TaxID=478744 RepID=UPI0023566C80|nr:2-amino-4-hydroxy-6-hydroxymethyldihydropteridine diphosphokinase [Neolewinella agarilytica]
MLLTIALGTNLGDKNRNLSTARNLIRERIGPIVRESTILETKAWGITEQPDFLNQVLVVSLDQHDFGSTVTSSIKATLHHLLDITQSIEQTLGRERKTHWGARTIDLDLIFLDDIRYEDERISLPHPWWKERDFVRGLVDASLVDAFGL